MMARHPIECATPEDASRARWEVDGKFFRRGGSRIRCNAVTYGPFPAGGSRHPDRDFIRIAAAGFNAVRIYQMPERAFLDAAGRAGLSVIAGLAWQASADFFAKPERLASAHVRLATEIQAIADHPALAMVLVGNEIPGDLVRWMGATRVREALEALIDTGREHAPRCLFGYASYPTTEYLEPENADFTAMNLYLEDLESLRAYLRRLHHIAGDRPLWISEFGMDSRRNGNDAQARLLARAILAAHDADTAGFTIYAWSDSWWNGHDVLDWDFGLVDRGGTAKPALQACADALRDIQSLRPDPQDIQAWPVSVIICTRNGGERIGRCLEACSRLTGNNIEVIVVDDGSTDGTSAVVSSRFPHVRLVTIPPSGLSAARNRGAAAAWGRILAYTDDDCEPDPEWAERLRNAFIRHRGAFDAIGGPNLPPPPEDAAQALVAAAPGAPSHVLIDDLEAEHLPGCNLAVTREAFHAIGGFDPRFRTAGDDVDFCWRLRDAGFRLAFEPSAFVWHVRRPTLAGYVRQQLGYGEAEALLLAKHTHRFTRKGDAKWEGFVYGGGPVRVSGDAVIYHGAMGSAGYQGLVSRTLPLRGIAAPYRTWSNRLILRAMHLLQPGLRAWKRNRRWSLPERRGAVACPPPDAQIEIAPEQGQDHWFLINRLLARGWQPGGTHDGWDLEKDGVRVLFASERGDGEVKRILVRIWGGTAASLDR